VGGRGERGSGASVLQPTPLPLIPPSGRIQAAAEIFAVWLAAVTVLTALHAAAAATLAAARCEREPGAPAPRAPGAALEWLAGAKGGWGGLKKRTA